ncbi:MAG TPA: TetR/AcrR family transcriptional regulator [Paenirhodobacter sp.]
MKTAPTMPTIRKGRKFAQVLDGARVIFMRDGFEGASVDEISKVAGVSKATLYSYFPDKRLLFLEVVRGECAHRADAAEKPLQGSASAREMLIAAGNRIVDFIVSDFGVAMFRFGAAEGQRFPEIGRNFYETGPMLLRQRLVGHLREFCVRGELAIEDFDLAADQFVELCKVDIQSRLILGVSTRISTSDRNRTINGAVDMFLARYGVSSSAPERCP